jgi:hypothetical protein
MAYFQTRNPNLGKFLEGLWMEKVRIFYAHLEYVMDNWYMLWPIGNLMAIWVVFHHFGTMASGKIWQPCVAAASGVALL